MSDSDDLFGSYDSDDEARMNEALPDLYEPYKNDPQWLSFLGGLLPVTAREYGKRAKNFMDFKGELIQMGEDVSSLSSVLLKYFEDKRAATNVGGSRRHSPTTFKSWWVILSRFHLYTGHGNLSEICPIMLANLKNWAKNEKVKQAAVFTKEDLETYFQFEDTPATMLRKCYVAIAISFAARTYEVLALDFSQLKLSTSVGGTGLNRMYTVWYAKSALKSKYYERFSLRFSSF
jgi:hypothetical protein